MAKIVTLREQRVMPHGSALDRFHHYDGTTYHGRSQLKPAPFENGIVGTYIFLAGLSGAAAVLSVLAATTGQSSLRRVERRSRYLALAAPILGAPLLIYDLRTPKRFYNMLRVAKGTSPMSIGTWVLMNYSGFSVLSAAAQAASDVWGANQRLQSVARFAAVPEALAGAVLATYTASLMSATSTPVWAAAPEALAVRYGASSMASAAAALTLGEIDPGVRGKLQAITAGALAVEAVAGTIAHRTYYRKGVEAAFQSPSGIAEKLGAKGLGVLLPLGLLAASALLGRRRGALSTAAAIATIAGSAMLRVSMLGVGDQSAARPDISFRFSTPSNLAEAEQDQRGSP
ncbi:MAG: polysulfide reductase NrfD [Alphaproteobacteria bacterium]|nr:polysulfide reductase NrfD [Alphaproteobacteria bacterium]